MNITDLGILELQCKLVVHQRLEILVMFVKILVAAFALHRPQHFLIRKLTRDGNVTCVDDKMLTVISSYASLVK